MAARARKKSGGGGKIIMILLVVLVIAGAAYWASGLFETEQDFGGVTIPLNLMTENGTMFTVQTGINAYPEFPVPHPETGEDGWPAYECRNRRCPGREGGKNYVFPVVLKPEDDIEFLAVTCPKCLEAGFDAMERTQTALYRTEKQQNEIATKLQSQGY